MNLREQVKKETGMKSHFEEYDLKYIEWLEQRNKEQVEVLERLVFLNQCELEGLYSGQPSPGEWVEAFEKAEEQLKKSE